MKGYKPDLNPRCNCSCEKKIEVFNKTAEFVLELGMINNDVCNCECTNKECKHNCKRKKV